MKLKDKLIPILTKIQQLNDKKIAIFGAGETGQEFVKLIRREMPNPKIVSFIDSNRIGEVLGLKIISPSEIVNLEADVVIVIASVFWNEIEQILLDDPKNKYLILSNELINTASHLSAYGSFYFDAQDIKSLEERKEKVLRNFNTEKDIQIFNKAFELRAYKAEHSFFEWAADQVSKQKKLFTTKNKYSANLNLESVEYVIEGGVFDGEDTVRMIERLSPYQKFKKIFAVDPDLSAMINGPHYAKLLVDSRCQFEESALYREDAALLLLFDRENPANSKVVQQADATQEERAKGKLCKGIRLDTFVNQNGIDSVDLIKLDTEGAEMDILRGAQNVIINHKPQLAVSLYHRKEHLLEIPEYLLACNPDYRFSMSLNNASFVDMVLYATVK